jgi:hypothetical protein
MRRIIVAASATVAIAALSVGASFPLLAHAYSWASQTYYLQEWQGQYYAYRTMSTEFGNWNGSLIPISRLTISGRISTPGYTYYGWAMAVEPKQFGGVDFRSSVILDQSFSMDINNGWVTKNEWNFTGANGGPTKLFGAMCSNSNNCGSFLLMHNGSEIVAGIFQNQTFANLCYVRFPHSGTGIC